MLTLTDISKSYGPLAALKRCAMQFEAGELTLLLGANGAGKSTLLKIISGLLAPDTGKVLFRGKKMAAAELGYAAQLPLLYGELTVAENCALIATLRGITVDPHALYAQWDLSSVATRRVDSLSKGTQARVSLMLAFMHTPKLLLLDEPTASLDERGTKLLLENIDRLGTYHNGDFSCIIATHDVPRLRSAANRIMVIAGGAVLLDSNKTTQAIETYYESMR